MNRTEVMREYRTARGASFGARRARIYGEELTRILDERGGYVSPHEIVAEGSVPGNPLHDFFDWNDRTAGESWRVQQARSLINSIEVRVRFPSGETGFLPIMQSVKAVIGRDGGVEAKEPRYVSVRMIERHAEYRDSIVEEAVKRLRAAIGTIEEVAALVGDREKDARLGELAGELGKYVAELQNVA